VHALLAHDHSAQHVLFAKDLRGATAAHWAAQVNRYPVELGKKKGGGWGRSDYILFLCDPDKQ